MKMINVPVKQISFYTEDDKKLIVRKLKNILSVYGNFIYQASKLFNIPEDLILSFVFIESSGIVDSISGAGAVGLMQVTPATASDMIFKEFKSGFLSEGKKAYLRNVIGNRLDCILSMVHMGQKLKCNKKTGVSITREDLLNPAFNIFLGTLYLSVLMREHVENGEVRLDKVVVRYNRGYFVKPKGTIQEIMAQSPKETRTYIAKLVGEFSPMDILKTMDKSPVKRV